MDKSWHSVSTTQPPPETTTKQTKALAPSAGDEDPLKAHQHGLPLSPSKKKVLEEHIKTFGKRMAFGLPQRVEESLESYRTKVEPPRSLSQFRGPSHTGSGLDSDKSSRLLQRNTSGDRIATVSLTPIQGGPLPASLPVGQRQPASESRKVFVHKELSKAPSGREAVQPWTPGMVDKGSLQQCGSDNRHSPELPMSPDGPTDERLASSTNTQGPRGERKSWEDGSMAQGSMEPLKKEELPGLHPQATKIVTAPQGTCSSGSHVAACESLQAMSAPHNSETPGKKGQVSRGGLLNSESGQHIQVPGLPALPFASEEVASKGQAPPSGDMAACPVLRAHMPTVGISMEPRRGLWVPAHVSGKLQNKDCPPAARRVSPLATEAEKLGGGDAGSGTSPTREKRHCVQARAPEGPHGRSSFPALAPKRQPPENHFTSQVRSLLQRLSPGRKHKGQQRPLAKGSFPSTSAKGTSLTQGSYEFCGNTEAQKCVRDPGVLLRKQLGHRPGTLTCCPQAPVPPLMGSGEAQQEVQGQAEAEPVQRPHSCCKAPCWQVQRAESCSPGQGQAAPERCGIVGKAKMVETSPMHASREPESHQGPVCRCRAGQVPAAALLCVEDTVGRFPFPKQNAQPGFLWNRFSAQQ